MKTDAQRWGEIKAEELIELVKIHRYEKCDEFFYPLMDEVIRRLEEHNKLKKIITNKHSTQDQAWKDLSTLMKNRGK